MLNYLCKVFSVIVNPKAWVNENTDPRVIHLGLNMPIMQQGDLQILKNHAEAELEDHRQWLGQGIQVEDYLADVGMWSRVITAISYIDSLNKEK